MSNEHISNEELLRFTKDLDQIHHDYSQPAMREAVAEWAELEREPDHLDRDRVYDDTLDENPLGRRHNRRAFLVGTGIAVAGGVALAACGSSAGGGSSEGSTAASSSSSGHISGDLQIVAMAASLENLAVSTYGAGIQAAQQGRLGTVPPAVPVFAKTVMGQHADHAKAWNAVLQQAGKKPVTGPDPVLKPSVDQAFAKVTDVAGLANLALELENTAAQTYQAGVGAISSSAGIKTAASIQPVEMQHAAILYYVLGKYPGIQDASGNPLAFNPTTMARPASDYQGGG